MGFDAGQFPIPAETKRLWESPDGGSLESLMRPPLAADRASQGWFLAWRMAATMRNDHVGALPLCTGPSRSHRGISTCGELPAYSPVLGRWTTLNDFFHLTDRPYETLRPEPDVYQTPYLAQAVAKRQQNRSGGWPGTIGYEHNLSQSARSQAMARAIALSAAKSRERRRKSRRRRRLPRGSKN